MDYRRQWRLGGCYFFTHTLLDRSQTLLTDQIELLRTAFRLVKNRYPFFIHAMVVLPDHFHCVLELPEGEHDFSIRFRLIKMYFSRALAMQEPRSACRIRRRERGIWQRRYWEHLIRDQQDFLNHLNYIHWNPVKHQLVTLVYAWPYSSFHRYVALGWYPLNWCCDEGNSRCSKIGGDDS
ncbi:MAG: REP-associated tyrosine transposase [Rheinheimera sp.]